MVRTLWDDTPKEARVLLPRHVCEHLKRAYYGRRVWVRPPGWIEYKEVRSRYAVLLGDGCKPTQAVQLIAEHFHTSTRHVWRILCLRPTDANVHRRQ